ncbi:hypothetical protein BIWAKO_04096 [Bosea sp. BIWAKO-01]|nr:hypothetical protein BIWAKO_04096 [Bosea sp. BIWAKO-01]
MRFGADYVFTEREYSVETFTKATGRSAPSGASRCLRSASARWTRHTSRTACIRVDNGGQDLSTLVAEPQERAA